LRSTVRKGERENGEEASMKTVGLGLLSIAMPLAFVIAGVTARADQNGPWDGIWTGTLGNSSAISVIVEKNKVVKYTFMGAPVPIQYNNLNAKNISFGDRDHYNMTLAKTSDMTASAVYHGRNGYASATLTKR
jgi:hypothetical protein